MDEGDPDDEGTPPEDDEGRVPKDEEPPADDGPEPGDGDGEPEATDAAAEDGAGEDEPGKDEGPAGEEPPREDNPEDVEDPDGEPAGEPPADGEDEAVESAPEGPTPQPEAEDADQGPGEPLPDEEPDLEAPPEDLVSDEVESGETAAGPPPEEDVTVSGTTPAAPEYDEPLDTDYAGAPDDQEMPLGHHVEEMVKRLAVVIVVMATVSAVTFPFADRFINFLWYSYLPGSPEACAPLAQAAAANASAAANATVDASTGTLANGTLANGTVANGTLANTSVANGTLANGTLGNTSLANATAAACPRIYHPLSLMLARLKMASLVGFVVALPVFVYQTYLFMRPGLYPNERRYYLASVPTSLVLAAIGAAFAYFLVLPIIFTYFLTYSQGVADIAFGLSQTFDLILLLMGMFVFIFQIPLFVMLAIMMGVTSRRWLESRRLYFWAGFLGIAFLFSPDPTGMAPFIVAITMVLLFEGTLLLLRWTGR